MPAWIAAMFVGLLIVGLRRDRTSRQAAHLILLVIIVVIGYQAIKIHAI